MSFSFFSSVHSLCALFGDDDGQMSMGKGVGIELVAALPEAQCLADLWVTAALGMPGSQMRGGCRTGMKRLVDSLAAMEIEVKGQVGEGRSLTLGLSTQER